MKTPVDDPLGQRSYLIKILRPAVVIPAGPEFKKWQPRVLGPGSIVQYFPSGRAAPRLDWVNEMQIEYLDEAGRGVIGHIDVSTPTVTVTGRAVEQSISWSGASGERLALVDILREAIALDRKSTVAYVKHHDHAGNRALYSGVVRERGGNVKADDPSLTERLFRTVLNREARMARKKAETGVEEQDIDEQDEEMEQDEEGDEEEAPRKAKGKKAAKKAAGKKAAKSASNGEGRTPQGVSLGNALVPLLREAGVKGAALQTAKQLQGGETVKKPALIALRDSINEAASAAREEDNGSLASKLSSANRVVRRLSRV